MLVIIHGKIRTMEKEDYEDGYLEIEQGKIVAIGDMASCDKRQLYENDKVQVIDAGGKERDGRRRLQRDGRPCHPAASRH